MKKIILIAGLLFSSSAFADWHTGKINMIAIGYDGKTISVGQEGFTRTNCTCYTAWPGRYCLDRTRESFKEEYSLLLSAKAQNKPVSINIDEASCIVTAIYE